MGSTADQYQDRPAGVLFCFDTSRYAAYFDISRQNTTIQGQNFLILQLFFYTLVFVLSLYLLEDACQCLNQSFDFP